MIVATGIFAVTYIHSAVKPMDKNATEFVTVEIPAGSSNREIGAILEKKGLVKNGQFFNYYTKFKNYSNFKSGYFNLQKSMDLETIIQNCKKREPKLLRLQFLERSRFQKVIRSIRLRRLSPPMSPLRRQARLHLRKKIS